MRYARAIFSAVALASIAACQLIAGIDDRPYDAPAPPAAMDASVPSVDAAPIVKDPCAHVVPPSPPDAAVGTNEPTFIFAVRALDFSSDGSHPGFDLDGVCTCDSRPGAAHGGASSCVLPKDSPAPHGCDDDGGIDNVAARLLLPFFESASFSGAVKTISQLAECGQKSILIVVTSYNGLADDAEVYVAMVPSGGIPSPTDGGADANSGGGGMACAADSGTSPPVWNGQDLWSVPSDSFVKAFGADTLIPTVQLKGYVRDYQVVVNEPNRAFAPGDIDLGPPTLSLAILDQASLLIHAPVLTMQLTPVVDDAGVEAGDAGPRQFLIAGMIGGRVSTHEVLSSGGSLLAHVDTTSNPTFVCAGSIYTGLKTTLCRAADVTTDRAMDFSGTPGTPCDAVSIALKFTAESAMVGQRVDPLPPVDAGDGGCGPAFQDWCDAGF